MRHKIALNGFGHIERVIAGSSANYCRCEAETRPLNIDFSDLLKIHEPFVSIVDS